jgi:hypothetical protein
MKMLFVPVAFVLLLGTIFVGSALFLWAMASAFGWVDLAKRFPAKGAPPEETWSRTSGFLDGERFRQAVDAGVGPAGLSLDLDGKAGAGVREAFRKYVTG